MPEAPQDDQYGIYDGPTVSVTAPSSSVPEPAPLPQAPAPPPAATGNVTSSSSERPRRPDGTFLPSQRLLDRARQLGIPDDTINRLPADELAEFVSNQQDALLLRQAEQQQELVERMTRRESVPEAPTGVASGEGGPAIAPSPSSGIGLSKEFLDSIEPSLSQFLQTLHQDVQSMKQRLAEVHGTVQAQADATATEQCDHFFNAHAEHFGTGRRAELPEGDWRRVRREAIVDLARRMKTPGGVKEKLDAATKAFFGGSAPTVPGGTVAPASPTAETPEQRRWSEAALAQPTAFKGKELPKGPARAAAAVEKLRQEQASLNGSFDATDDDLGLPE